MPDVLLDELEKALSSEPQKAEPEPQKAEPPKAEAPAPSAEDPRVKALEEALRISEEARKKQEELLASFKPQPQPQRELSKEELAELYSRDPVAAIEYLQARSMKVIEENLSKRLEPLMSGGMLAAKQAAMAKYKDEFELFGKDIEALLSDPRISRESLSSPQAWDDLIAYVRGRPGNLEKLIEYKVAKEKESVRQQVQEREAAIAGAHARSDIRAPAPQPSRDLDDIEKEIARTIFAGLEPNKAYEEYKKWRDVTR